MRIKNPRRLVAKVLILTIAFLYLCSLLIGKVLAPCAPMPTVYDAEQCNPLTNGTRPTHP